MEKWVEFWKKRTDRIAFYPYSAYPISEKLFRRNLEYVLRLCIQSGKGVVICNPQTEIDYWFLQVVVMLRKEYPHLRLLFFTIYPLCRQSHAPILDSWEGRELLNSADWAGAFSEKICSSTAKKRYIQFLSQQAAAVISVLPHHLKGRTGIEKYCAKEHTPIYNLREEELTMVNPLCPWKEDNATVANCQCAFYD